MFEITPNDIALLNDEDLRALVARLCEAELRSFGFSASYVTSGGDQNATDGGIDVRVELPNTASISGFVPCLSSGFQVKAEDMQPAKIRDEMRPRNTVRPAIQDLANRGGAYVIVSSKGSTSDTSLAARRSAMAQAVSDLPHAGDLTVDFYDRTRIASWVQVHRAQVPWVRQKIGKSIRAWRAYEDWAQTPQGVDGTYLVDDSLKLQTRTEQGLRIADGIRCLRDLLRRPGSVARLVGLSGVGKTRLVQSLFDDQIGEQSLDPSLAAYTDMADDPDPQPMGLASDLVASRTRAILVVDNCPPDLHRRISAVCRMPGSTTSLITVEYDIREDEPEETEVFKLEASSDDLIRRLVRKRFPDISIVNVQTIVNFSGGNARIAISLAGALWPRETIADLPDSELLRRLVQQRHGPDNSLQSAAEACAIVYSFQAEDTRENPAELGRLGAMIGQSSEELYRQVAELWRRGLVQRRSIWRAVLPHAIANRLATRALQNIPISTIEDQLTNRGSSRLFKSFSRRLGYLHKSEEARAIARKWLAPTGRLADLLALDEAQAEIFENIAPTDPDAALESLERALAQDDPEKLWECRRYIDVLRSLAYEQRSFERSVTLISKIAESGDLNERQDKVEDAFASLFHLYFSGTCSTLSQRLAIIERFLAAENVKRRTLGFLALKAALETLEFDRAKNFDFGAHVRGPGYSPRNPEEAIEWYTSVLQLTERLACSNSPAALLARAALAQKFETLWNRGGVYEELERTLRAIRSKQFWSDGWLSICQTITLSAQPSTDITARLARLEEALRPVHLTEQVRSIVLSTRYMDEYPGVFSQYVDDDPGSGAARTESLARELGRAVATNGIVFRELLPELVSSRGQLWPFALGLAEAAENARGTWDQLVAQYAATEENEQQIQTLRGFLKGLDRRSPELVHELLDEAVERAPLAAIYPSLQTSIELGDRDIARLKRSIVLGKAPAGAYQVLYLGDITDPISGADFRDLTLALAAKPDGLDIATRIVHMRLFSETQRHQPHGRELLEVGRHLVRKVKFTRDDRRRDTDLANVAKLCLVGEEGASAAQEVCSRLKAAVRNHETYPFYHGGVVSALLFAQPTATLDALLGGDESELDTKILDATVFLEAKPLDLVPDEQLFDWCECSPGVRYPAAAGLITFSTHSGENSSAEWTPRARALIRRAPDRVSVLKQFVHQFRPIGGFVGSTATILRSNAGLLDALEDDEDPALVAFLPQARTLVHQAIEDERHRETVIGRQLDERFEW